MTNGTSGSGGINQKPDTANPLSVKLIFLILFVCFHAIASGQPSEGFDVWWVYFTDRGPNLENRLSLKTIELIDSPSYDRRISAGLFEADELDLYPWADYVTKVENLLPSGSIRTASRYLNAVSVCAAADDLNRILNLPFVDRVSPASVSTFQPPVFQPITWTMPELTSSQLSQIHLDDLHERGWTGQGIVIGVLDSGFNLTHNVFQQIDVILQYDFINDYIDPSQQPGDPPGQSDHGTAVLSLLGGYCKSTFSGGVPDASFILAKTEDTSDEYQAEEDYWVQGLEWVEENGADLVSNSLGYIDWYTYADMDGNTAVTTIAADAAASRGMPVFSAVGNRGPDSGSLIAPADGDSVFAVGAVNVMGNVAQFSSRGPTYDGRIKPSACALGENVLLAYRGENEYSFSNGTSFATPLAASAAGAIHQAHPEWSMMEIIDILKITALNADSPDNDTGYGILNAFSALKYHSLTGSARLSYSGEYLPNYPITINLGDSIYIIETNQSGWFAFCPGELGSFSVSSAGGEGSVIPVSGTLVEEGVEIQVFVDQDPGSGEPTVYPNPSTCDIYVGFDMMNGPSDVSILVYDLLGQIIHSSTRTSIGPGSFRAPLPGEAFFWDGLDDAGEPAASGIYIVMLRIGENIHLIKFALVR
ncbi:MAG: S8 family serine peptidase [Candidatus Fermentibacteraceae bacterium]|nr:S8 family serine peptidase [Candidatus Fermentibacteraceae bacterium]